MSQNAPQKDSTGKLIILGIQHVFAMFGATVLVPALTGLNPSVALLCAGLGTLFFHLCTKGKVPTYLGSSFAFIAGIVTVAGMYAKDGDPNYGLSYATGAIVVAGALYLVLAALVLWLGANRIKSFFPPVVTGPMIIIIGMMLAPTAISSIVSPMGTVSVGWNWLVALVTIASIMGISLWAKGLFKLVPVLFGIVFGYLASAVLTWLGVPLVNMQPVRDAAWISLPAVFLPRFGIKAICMIAPIAIVTFVEHIGDITANGAVVGKDFVKDPGLHRTLIGDGGATMLAGLLGGPANTTYSENTGVLAATGNYNPVTLRIAACIAILLSLFGKLGALLQTLPGPVMGGVSVVLFGMIAAVGLRTLVGNGVDFKATRNLLIVAVMLVFGLGGASISFHTENFGDIAFSGTALAAILGIVLNKALPAHIEKDA
ncbi:MAG: uracil-xanthine permease family protein [Oscillospiraceae bacterium]|jgi:uracil permease|nr:uracil-xanthine permease family protein [Oscillospiraceae bacterium]